MTMTIFTRAINAEINQHRKAIARAYQAAGKTMPDTATRIRELIMTTETTQQVAQRLAREAYDATNPDEFYRDALDQINEARAAHELKDAFNRAANGVAQQKITTEINTAAKEINADFNRTAKDLTNAAKKLDPIHPLEAETAIALDAGEALTTARQALKQLSTYASIHAHYPHTIDQRALRDTLAIVDIPTPTVELCYRTPGAHTNTANEHELTVTRMIRRLHEALKRDTDSTLVNIARGDYKGVTLSLATDTEHRERLETAKLAFQRKTVEPTGRLAFI